MIHKISFKQIDMEYFILSIPLTVSIDPKEDFRVFIKI